MEKKFKKFLDDKESLPLKPTLAQMQKAVDEHREHMDKIIHETRKSNMNYHKEKAEVEKKIAKLLENFLTKYEVTCGKDTKVIAPYGFVNGFQIQTELDNLRVVKNTHPFDYKMDAETDDEYDVGKDW